MDNTFHFKSWFSRHSSMIAIMVTSVVVVGVVIAIAMRGGTFTPTRSDPSQGPQDATVVVREFSDFQCPACQAAKPAVKKILQEFSGKIRFEYNDFPLSQHQFSTDAAIAAECANAQGKFWEFHDTLFDKQGEWSVSANTDAARSTFITYAQDLGLNVETFLACTASQEASDIVNEDIREAQRLGVNSTPTFFVNGKKVRSQDSLVESLRTAIQNELGK